MTSMVLSWDGLSPWIWFVFYPKNPYISVYMFTPFLSQQKSAHTGCHPIRFFKSQRPPLGHIHSLPESLDVNALLQVSQISITFHPKFFTFSKQKSIITVSRRPKIFQRLFVPPSSTITPFVDVFSRLWRFHHRSNPSGHNWGIQGPWKEGTFFIPSIAVCKSYINYIYHLERIDGDCHSH